ncbi:MFS transporter [Fangia hongkongensis]|uniref:MFS transporter n=1 Tax=Fangia hongkongensis TaxID=270495 RepID=UPI00036F4B54|nr:MFS transporter [Fangia hongkongensis]MBK2125535.1 MFS transporter [Fangia hongkongensis]
MKRTALIKIGFVSNIFEWYDFVIYAYLAAVIGQLFFPSTDQYIALIKAFILFSVSYLVRPIGSIFFGILADKYTRSFVLRASLILMAIPTLVIAFLPTYAQAGIFASAGLIILRLIQGFAAGGELPISACYMYEASPSGSKGFYSSFVAASSMTGVLLGSITIGILYAVLGSKTMLEWGWRVPFFLGFIGVIFVFYIRRKIVEPEKTPLKTNISTLHGIVENWFPMLQVIMLNAFISIAFYLLFVWMPSYLHVFLKLSSVAAFTSSSLSLFFLIVFTLIFGYFSPKLGRRNMAITSIITILILCYPMFHLLKHGNFLLVVLVQLIFAVCMGFIQGINMEMMASRFSHYFRGRGISIGFTLSTAVFGGLAPTLSSYLIHKTHSDISPILFLIASCLIALPVALTLKNK